MWNSFGSLRDRVREHAKSAAQVAQGVLQAAAAEQDYAPEPEQENQQQDSIGWGGWEQHDQQHGNNNDKPVHAPRGEVVPPPPVNDAPPPPPDDAFVSAKPPVINAPRSRRGSRYVVTGVATSQSQATQLLVPKPEPFVPNSQTENQIDNDAAWDGWGKPDNEPENATDKPTSTHSPSEHVQPPPADLPPPPADDVPHSPPPDESFVSARPPVVNAASQSRPGSRYVVKGVATSQPQGGAPVVPTPEPIHQQDSDTAWAGTGQPEQEAGNGTVDFMYPQSDAVPPPPSDVPAPPLSDDVPPPPPDDAGPPPLPEDSFVSAKPHVINAAPSSRRGSRYVVAGVATSQPQETAPVVPTPSFFAPKPPVISAQPGDDAADGETGNGDTVSGIEDDASTYPPVDVEPYSEIGTHFQAEPDTSSPAVPERAAAHGNDIVPEASSFPASTPEPQTVDETLFAEHSKTEPPAEDTFAEWGSPAEQQNGRSTAASPAENMFLGWGFDDTPTEHTQPESVPPPPEDDNVASWTAEEITVEQQEDSSMETQTAANSVTGWGVPGAPVEAVVEQQTSESPAAGSVQDSFSNWSVPGMSAEQKEATDTAETPAEDAFAGWDVQEASTVQQSGQNAEAPPTENNVAHFSVPKATVEAEQNQGTEAPPEANNFANWRAPEALADEQKSQSTTAATTDSIFADWSVPDPSTSQQNGDKGWDLGNPSVSADEQKSQSTTAATTDSTFADWSVPDPSTGQQQNGEKNWDLGNPSVSADEQKSQSTTAATTDSTFADWSVPDPSTGQQQNGEKNWDLSNPAASADEQKSQSTTAATTDSTFADWSVPDPPTDQRQNEEKGWDPGNSVVKPSEPKQGDDTQKDAAFEDWGDADGGWNLGDGSSAAQDVGDGVDWFSSGAANAVAQDALGSTTEDFTSNEELLKEVPSAEGNGTEETYKPSPAPQLTTPTISEEPTSGKETKEEHDVTSVPTSKPDFGNAEGTAAGDEDAEKNATENENHEFKISSRIPDVTSHGDNNAWSIDATPATAENYIDPASSAVEEQQWNMQTAGPVINSQKPLFQDEIVSSGPAPPAEAWFSDHAAQEGLQDTVSQGKAHDHLALHEPANPEQDGLISQSSEMALQIRQLQEQMRNAMLERDSAIASKEASERDNNDLKRSIELIENDVALSREESGYLAAQRDGLQKERDTALEQKMEVEKERDEAIQRGGQGLREATNVIEVMRSNQDSTEKREAAITEQIEALRKDLDRMSEERNTLLGEAEDLRIALKNVESRSRQREDELRQQLQIAEHESEIARLEREKALETNELHMDENRRLTDVEKGRATALAESESRVAELENYITSLQTDREDENMRIEFFSNQIEEMKDRTQGVIDERNELYDEKRNLENQIEEQRQREEAFTRGLHDAKREAASLASERDEAKQRYISLKDQQKELMKRVDSLAGERDQLVQARTAATASSSVSEKEKALAMECEQKTRAVAILQKKLSSAIAKIEKVTTQRSTFQRQRDEAGARLRAAGVEFASLNSKLEDISNAKSTAQNQLVQVRDERDAALSRLEEMNSLDSQLKLAQDSLDSKSKEVEDAQLKLKEAKVEVATMHEANATAQQRASSLTADLSELQGRVEVVSREKDLIATQKDDLEEEKSTLQQTLSERRSSETQLSKQLKSMEADYTTLKEKSTMDLGIAKAELVSEQKLHEELKLKLSAQQREFSESTSVLAQIRRTIASCAETIRSDALSNSEAVSSADWQKLDDLLASGGDLTDGSIADLVSRYNEISMKLIRDSMNTAEKYEALQAKYDNSTKALLTLEQDKAELLASASDVKTLSDEIQSARRDLEAGQAEKVRMESEIGNLQEQLGCAATQRAELEARIEAIIDEMQEEMQRREDLSIQERDRLVQETEKVTTNLNSIWSMLRKSLGDEQMERLTDEVSQYGQTDENIAILALRGTASVVAEISRNRSHIEDIETKLVTAEAEASRLIDRAEIAEQERDTAKGTNERLERKIKVSHAEGQEEAKGHYEGIIGHLEDNLEDTRQELSRIADKASRSEKETSELRALCSKLTSQFNGRTNELDEAEEKVVYLQDQVTTLEEDLEEAHARLKKLEEESAEARQSDVKRLTHKLEETTAQLEQIEKECTRLREAQDEAENVAKESRLLADTHKQAEENLQIAIEQLEAAQESALEQRTIELQKKLEDAEQRCEVATERETAAAVDQKQLNIRDEEIKELRGAIGRLADERVELKLELEKSLSRLNHPDAGGQLVDRRVVRQLLVSYFRVGSVRRRDVLELMSRMLAFSDSDNIAVGLKRRALMDRLGSLVQAPELDDASLPPLGTVSDKWIEFLMKETEEGEEQAKGW